jgi:hypothetical protein
MFWVAFSLSFVLTNASYIVAALSDPLGLGWNLFGTANTVWQPMLTTILAPAQTLALVGGLIWSARTAQKAAKEVKVSSIPVILLFIVTSICFGCCYKYSETHARILIILAIEAVGLLTSYAAYPANGEWRLGPDVIHAEVVSLSV